MSKPSDALSALLQQGQWINRLARALIQDAAEAEDLVQDLWLAALKQPPQAGTERAWSRSVLKRRLADRRRLKERRPQAASLVDAPGGLDPLSVSATLESHARLGTAIQALSLANRELIVARYFHGEAPKAMARRLGLNEATLRSQLSRALAELRQDLQADDPEHPQAWALALIPIAMKSLKTGPITTVSSSLLAAMKVMGIAMSNKTLAATAVVLLGFFAYLGSEFIAEEVQDLRSIEVAGAPDATNVPSRHDSEFSEAVAATHSARAASTSGAATSATTVTIQVVDSDERPVVAARVLLYRDNDLFLHARSDDRGAVAGKRHLGLVSCLVIAPGHRLFKTEIELGQDQRLLLPRRATMSGIVRVHGGLPYRPMVLRVRQDDEALAEVPKSIRKAVWGQDYHVGLAPCPVAADGSFQMDGLIADQEVEIFPPVGFAYFLDDKFWRQGKTFPRPQAGMTLELMAMPMIKARLIDAQSAEPLGQRNCSLSVRDTVNGGQASLNNYSNELGEISIAIGLLEFEAVELRVQVGTERRLVYAGESFRDILDLGDIPLAIPSAWPFQVVDSAGLPIAGAIAVIEMGGESAKTDEHGFSSIPELSETFGEAVVAASGFRAETVAIQRQGSEPQRIQLAKSNLLEVTVTGLPQGVRADELLLRGSGSLLSAGFQSGAANRFNRISGSSLSDDEKLAVIYLRPEADAVFRIRDLPAGAPFVLELRGEQDQFLATTTALTMAAREHKTLTLPFDSNRVQLTEFKVVDANGAAIADAEIIRHGLGDEGWNPSTNEAGEFKLLRDTQGPMTGLRIEAEGFLAREIEIAELQAGELRVVLEAR